ncbi:MAG: ubiquinone/menaquinone biosynthesis methyltransferase [Thermodesulfobacteriota bacterium]
MNRKEKQDQAKELQRLFGGISGRYDLLNRLISLGRDKAWRRRLVEKAALPPGGSLLDIGTGTGGIALTAVRQDPSLRVTAADYTVKMMLIGRRKLDADTIGWCAADALRLPFQRGMFDAVASGYLIRNVSNPEQAFKEQMRVTKQGGRVVCLDTSPPAHNLLRPIVVFYLRSVIPLLGKLIAKDRAAYEYLPRSTQAFMKPDELASTMKKAGLKNVEYKQFMLGTQVMAAGIKP